MRDDTNLALLLDKHGRILDLCRISHIVSSVHHLLMTLTMCGSLRVRLLKVKTLSDIILVVVLIVDLTLNLG